MRLIFWLRWVIIRANKLIWYFWFVQVRCTQICPHLVSTTRYQDTHNSINSRKVWDINLLSCMWVYICRKQRCGYAQACPKCFKMVFQSVEVETFMKTFILKVIIFQIILQIIFRDSMSDDISDDSNAV